MYSPESPISTVLPVKVKLIFLFVSVPVAALSPTAIIRPAKEDPATDVIVVGACVPATPSFVTLKIPPPNSRIYSEFFCFALLRRTALNSILPSSSRLKPASKA